MADIIEKKLRKSKNVLLGTVVDHECDPEEDCSECRGSGICPDCHGKGKDTCHTCHGNGQCTKCHGRGRNTCSKCNGQGRFRCNECGGTGTCRKCGGSGKVRCDSCGGRGRRNDGSICAMCKGSGYIACSKCSGLVGRLAFGDANVIGKGRCSKCKGTGEIICSKCDGAGEIICNNCHGDGNCTTCSGRGEITCSNCNGDGRCPDCSGTGRVTCHRCKGSGWYQTYQYYVCTEYSKNWTYINKGDLSSIITKGKGIIIYDSSYKSWSSATNVDYDKSKEMEEICKGKLGQFASLFDDFKSSYSNQSELQKPSLSSDKPLKKVLKSEVIPATKIDYTINGESYSLYLYGENNIVAYNSVPTTVKTYEQTIFQRIKLALSEKSRMKQYAKLAAYIFQCDGKNKDESRLQNLMIKELKMSKSKEDKFRAELEQYNKSMPYEVFRKEIKKLFTTKKTISFAWQCMAVDKTVSEEEKGLFDNICSEYKNIGTSEIEKLKSYANRFSRIKDDNIVSEYCDISLKSKELRKKIYLTTLIVVLMIGAIAGIIGLITSGAFNGIPDSEYSISNSSKIIEHIDELCSDISFQCEDWDEKEWNEATSKLEKALNQLPSSLEENEKMSLSLSLSSVYSYAEEHNRIASEMLKLLNNYKDLIDEVLIKEVDVDDTSVEEISLEDDKATEVDASGLVIEKIHEFYMKYVFGHEEATDKVINNYCTKKLAKKLADDYEEEAVVDNNENNGGGYAVWDFRSGAQDGDSDIQKVDSVEALGEGKYKVSYNDMGNKGSCIISVVVDGDKILFDEIN